MNYTEVLERTREIVQQGWTRGVAARDEQGRKVRYRQPDACEWCLTGAMAKALHEEWCKEFPGLAGVEMQNDWSFKHAYAMGQHLAWAAQTPKNHTKKPMELIRMLEYWNDRPSTTQQEVLLIIDGAIAASKRGDTYDDSMG